MVEAAGVSLSQPEQQNAAERAAGDRLPPLFPDDLTPSKAADVSSFAITRAFEPGKRDENWFSVWEDEWVAEESLRKL